MKNMSICCHSEIDLNQLHLAWAILSTAGVEWSRDPKRVAKVRNQVVALLSIIILSCSHLIALYFLAENVQ